ncbi:hypothetical protein BH24DEI1_BH24DEI1_08540 [soil metagenome]
MALPKTATATVAIAGATVSASAGSRGVGRLLRYDAADHAMELEDRYQPHPLLPRSIAAGVTTWRKP